MIEQNQPRKKAILFARVSTLDQEKNGLSLYDEQVPRLEEYANKHNFEIVERFVFSETASMKTRKKFDEIIAYLKKHREVTEVIGYHVDRLTRNYRDAAIIDDLRLNYGKQLHFVMDGLVVNKDSKSSDIVIWDFFVLKGKMQILNYSENSKIFQNLMIENGLWPHKGPYGYVNIRRGPKDPWIIPDGVKARIIKRIFQLYCQNVDSAETVAEKVKKEFDLKKLKRQAVLKYLSQPFYYGMMYWDGKLWPHKYEKLIDQEQYDRAQEILTGRHTTKYKGHGREAIYRGVIKCSVCNHAMTPEFHKNDRYIYYHCSRGRDLHKGAPWVKEEDITKQFVNIFNSPNLTDEDVKNIVDGYNQSREAQLRLTIEMRHEYQTELDKYTAMWDEVYDDKLIHRITPEECDQKLKDVQAKKDFYKGKLRDLDRDEDDYLITSTFAINLVSIGGEVFESSETYKKRRLLQFILQNCTLEGDKLRPDFKNPFSNIFKTAGTQVWGG